MTTDNDSKYYAPYRAALEGDWDFQKFYNKDNAFSLSTPLTAAEDTAFHLAVFSNGKQPLEYLLGIDKEKYAFSAKNKYGDTVLHVAAANGNLEAVKLLVDHDKELSEDDENTKFLEDINDKGETPLFKAAANGKTKVVKFLASMDTKQLIIVPVYETTDTGERKKVKHTKLKDIHRQANKNDESQPSKSPTAPEEKPSAALEEETIELHEPFILQANKNDESQPSKSPTAPEEKPSAALEEETIELHEPSILQANKNDESQPSKSPTAPEEKPSAALEEETIELHEPSILQAAIQGEYFETAILLLKLDKDLANLTDKNGWNSLHLLATLSSGFKSGYRMWTWISKVLYFCLPIDDRIDDEKGSCFNLFKGWWILGKICSSATKVCEAKRKHKLALRLAKSLIEENDSCMSELIQQIDPLPDAKPSPLFLATERGIIKIVQEILKVYPQLVECENKDKQNILHVAIKHRQKKIFDHVKMMKIPMTRLIQGIDKDGYTILHHAANTKDDTTKVHPAGPVYQLQEELKWYKRVKKMTPSHYRMFRDIDEKKTCKGLFNVKHDKLLGRAQAWIKETSQSCSAVSVLVATVVFAAAYTVPGGSNDQGYPVFLNNNFFLIFTVMDVVALACSLTSVVMFLSVLTSPFHYEEFLHKLPRKLTIGFSLLFIALTTTMLAFAATLLLIVRFQKPRWTTTLIYTAAFFPVSIFALTQFPMYVALNVAWLKFYKWIKKFYKWIKKAPCSKWFKKKLSTNDVSFCVVQVECYHGARHPV